MIYRLIILWHKFYPIHKIGQCLTLKTFQKIEKHYFPPLSRKTMKILLSVLLLLEYVIHFYDIVVFVRTND
ncbi:unnamed protein product [Schistosoma intercalatum]|nr:unnamed protein product [Schistosoma intercalatum]